MTVGVKIRNFADGHEARVSKFGQLITAPLDFSSPQSQSLNVVDTAFNFATPRGSDFIVITDILMGATKDVNASTGALVEIYTSDISATSTVIKEVILEAPLARLANRDLTGLNFLVNSSRWVNAKTDNATVDITIGCYFVPKPTFL